ncbi:MAG: BglII/BstYI family type II restriction endonuclease [Candidatus Sumerlaeaceae bacterium]
MQPLTTERLSVIQVPELAARGYEIHEWKHATAILRTDFPEEWQDIAKVMNDFSLRKSAVVAEGGGKTKDIAGVIDAAFTTRGWREKGFATKVVVDEHEMDSPTHKVDCYKNRVALELEWNNKDPFFDRDLNNFRLLFDLRAISVGIIITRCDELQDIFDGLYVTDSKREAVKQIGKKYGPSTTHLSRLLPRIEGGGGGGCPILVIGISKAVYVEDVQGYSKDIPNAS